MKGNLINDCDFFLKFIISVRGSHTDCLPQKLKTLAMTLNTC